MPKRAPEHPTTATRLILRAVRRAKGPLAGLFALITSWQLCEALVPVLIGVIIDRAVATGDLGALGLWGGALVVLFAVLSYSYRFGSRIGFGVCQREMHELRLEIAGRELDPRGVRSGLLPGETLSLATNDVELVGYTLRSAGFAVAGGMAVVVSAVLLLRTDVVLGLVVLAGVPAVLLVIQVVTPAIARRSSDQQALIAHTAGVATDLVRGLRGLKGIGAEDVASARYRPRATGRARPGCARPTPTARCPASRPGSPACSWRWSPCWPGSGHSTAPSRSASWSRSWGWRNSWPSRSTCSAT